MKSIISNEDEMPLISLEYIINDYIKFHYNLSSTMLKSAISSYNLKVHEKM